MGLATRIMVQILTMWIKEISEIAEEFGLDNVDPLGITEGLESNSQPMSNEEICDLAQQLTEQQKEDEDEDDRGTKAMPTDILSATDMAAEGYVISTLNVK